MLKQVMHVVTTVLSKDIVDVYCASIRTYSTFSVNFFFFGLETCSSVA